MSVIYKKSQKKNIKRIVRFFGLGLTILGLGTVLFIFIPYLSYQVTDAKAFASQNLTLPIPQVLVVTNNTKEPPSVLDTGDDSLMDAENWFPTYENNITVQTIAAKPRTTLYYMSIPKLGIRNAKVSTTDLNLAQHMVNYPGTAIPTEKGNAVVFAHSTLPQLFNPSNYKTILADAYQLSVGDTLLVTVDNQTYTYTIYNITVVDPDDTSVFAQTYDNSYLTLITCTPPGTVLQRLVIKSRLQE